MRILRALFEVVRSWWAVDRIRTSPVDGSLLRLLPGDIVRSDGVDWTVVERRARAEDEVPRIEYALRSRSGERSRLTVERRDLREPPRVRWNSPGTQRSARELEIELWPRKGGARPCASLGNGPTTPRSRP